MNDGPSGWVMCSGLSGSRRCAARMRSGMCLGTYSPITSGVSTSLAVLDPQQLHRVEVDHAVQSADQVGVRVHARPVLEPGVRPAEPAVAEFGRRDGVAVGPGVHEDDVDVGDAAPGERREDVRMSAQHLVALDELVDGEVGLHAGHVLERLDAIVGERHHALVGGVRASGSGRPPWRGARGWCRPLERAQLGLGRARSVSIEAKRQPNPGPPACTSCSRRKICSDGANSSADSGSRGCVTRLRNHISRCRAGASRDHDRTGVNWRRQREALPRHAGGRRPGRTRRGSACRTP